MTLTLTLGFLTHLKSFMVILLISFWLKYSHFVLFTDFTLTLLFFELVGDISRTDTKFGPRAVGGREIVP